MTKKHIKDLGENEVIHAPTEKERKIILLKLKSLDININERYLDNINEFETNTCFCPRHKLVLNKEMLPLQTKVYTIENLFDFSSESPQPHYDNSKKSFRSLMELGQKLELNHYEQDILKRLVRCRKKGQFKQDLQKIKDTIDIYLNEYDDERNRD
ncbi:hypothetical protein [Elizabethkingia bruuniana]|uniref:hypothetical protein n=1 Tax=Elizabethkingia bruuniana TaxID=1756149 RepID=UPI000BEAFE45|nr:hypothetical protein [Elizabethkingia bruuniana]ATL41832.1 hypothetical protein CQS02_00205 [Elizabethkingia miricola]MCL1636219.1 hypothetical protein [Elizabethkingia bruuniana]